MSPSGLILKVRRDRLGWWRYYICERGSLRPVAIGRGRDCCQDAVGEGELMLLKVKASVVAYSGRVLTGHLSNTKARSECEVDTK
jgi:hypothetical protein